MSHAPALTERALAGLRELEFWLQEETLDEIERVAANLPVPPRRKLGGAVHDFVRERSGVRFYVFITYAVDLDARVLSISEIGTFSRPVH